MAHYVFHERFDTPTGYAWRVGTVCLSESEARHVGEWLAGRKPPQSFEPNSPEPVSASYTTEPVPGGYPPNCDGNAQCGQEPTQAGYALAQAQHEAAESGDNCTAGACLLTRGSD